MAWLVNFSQFMVFYLLVTIMALYAATQFAASNTAAGFASSAFVVGATGARLFSGYIVDSVGRKKSLMISLVVVAVACLGYFFAHNLLLLFVVRIVHGMGYAIASTAVMAVAQAGIPDGRRAEGTGYFAAGSTLATALGPAAGLAMTRAWGYDVLFGTVVVVSLVTLALALPLRTPQHERPSVSFSLGNIVHPAVAPIGIFTLLMGTAYSGIITYLNPYSEETGLAKGAGLFFFAYAGVNIILRLVLGRVQDKRGDNIIVYAGLASFVAGLALLASAGQNWEVVASGILIGTGYGAVVPATQAIAVRLVPLSEMGTGISTLFLLLDVGIGFGPLLLGVIISATGFSTMYWILAVLVGASSIVYYLLHGRRDVAKAPVAS